MIAVEEGNVEIVAAADALQAGARSAMFASTVWTHDAIQLEGLDLRGLHDFGSESFCAKISRVADLGPIAVRRR